MTAGPWNLTLLARAKAQVIGDDYIVYNQKQRANMREGLLSG